MKCNLSIFSFVASTFSIVYKMTLPSQSHKDLQLFYFKSFIVLAIIFTFIIHFVLIFVYSVSRGSRSICVWIFSCSNPICWRNYYFPIEESWHTSLKSVEHNWISKSASFIYTSSHMSVLQCLDNCSFV